MIINEENLNSSTSLADSLETSPLFFKIKRKRIEDLSTSSKKYFKNKFNKAKEKLKSRFAEAAAPGQEEAFMRFILDSSSDEEDNYEIDDHLLELVNIYQNSNSISQMVILSLINHDKYRKNDIMNIFGCTKHKIEQSRKWKKQNDGLCLPKNETHTRNRMNFDKCEHFVDFIFTSGLLQDVAYGVQNLKFDSGNRETIPKAILTSRYSHAITFYKQTCIEVDYEPLSESTLWKILTILKPSQRKSLAGLDDTIAAGMNGFDDMGGLEPKMFFSKSNA